MWKGDKRYLLRKKKKKLEKIVCKTKCLRPGQSTALDSNPKAYHKHTPNTAKNFQSPNTAKNFQSLHKPKNF